MIGTHLFLVFFIPLRAEDTSKFAEVDLGKAAPLPLCSARAPWWPGDILSCRVSSEQQLSVALRVQSARKRLFLHVVFSLNVACHCYMMLLRIVITTVIVVITTIV